MGDAFRVFPKIGQVVHVFLVAQPVRRPVKNKAIEALREKPSPAADMFRVLDVGAGVAYGELDAS
jgi:hypothetical protein